MGVIVCPKTPVVAFGEGGGGGDHCFKVDEIPRTLKHTHILRIYISCIYINTYIYIYIGYMALPTRPLKSALAEWSNR